MTDGQSEKPKRIDFTEAFHRAKRNTLWWSTIVILVSFGTASGTDPVRLTTPVGGLDYGRDFLIAGSAIALLATIVGYFRALGRVPLDDAISKSVDGLLSASRHVQRFYAQAGEASNAISRALQAANSLEERIFGFQAPRISQSEFLGDLKEAAREWGRHDQAAASSDEVHSRRTHEMIIANQQAQEHLLSVIKSITEAVTRKFTEHYQIATQSVRNDLVQAVDSIPAIDDFRKAADDVIAEIASLTGKVSRSEEVWHRADDRWLVYVAWAAALISAIISAFAPTLLNWTSPSSPPTSIPTSFNCPNGCMVSVPPPPSVDPPQSAGDLSSGVGSSHASPLSSSPSSPRAAAPSAGQ